jgi:L-malate glycosyltransferase
MRVLWFTNDPLPAVEAHFGKATLGSGHWMWRLLDEMAGRPGLELQVATAYQGYPDAQFERDGVRFVVIGQPRFTPFFGCRKQDLERAAAVARAWAPDLIHIHGSERFYGLLGARGLVDAPCVISVQGLLGPYVDAFLGNLSFRELWQSESLVEVATRRGLLWRYHDYVKGARQEREIIAGTDHFMGRTDWDRTQVRRLNPAANYYYAGEVLRKDFCETNWSLPGCERHSVIFTNAGEPRRGAEVLLEALRLLRGQFPDAKLKLAGGIGERRGYGRFLRRRIQESGLSGSVEFLGPLDGRRMAAELAASHVFAISSFLENSPNSLCEAMRMGLPCVASFAGGIPNLVNHGQTGLLFPPGDAPLLADAIERIFRDDSLAVRLGQAARTEATHRHAPENVVNQVLNAYQCVIENAHPNERFQTAGQV